ncbi:Rab interacting lysosomal protein like [Carabus blaptoides fortunei]
MPKKQFENNFAGMDDACDIGGEVSVVDVYDIASEIGKECEKIIDQFGAEAVTSLMPKVINALELLENLATKNERENTQMQELRAKILQLENDKIEKAEYRQRFEKELEAIEEQWRLESRELVSVVSKLQDENRRLVKVQGSLQGVDVPSAELNAESGIMLQRLQTIIDKQREELRVKERHLQDKISDIENLKLQVERVTGSNRELRRKHRSLQSQVRTLCDERADFLVQLQDQQRSISALRQRLGLAQKENEDLAKSDSEAPDLTNKAVYDLDDPNRPRFTTAELKDILHERNELKARVSDLEDELETYRPKNKADTFSRYIKHVTNTPIIIVPEIASLEEQPIEEDAPVQGPLPYEPDDAPWKKSESGIRKFFRKIFSEGGNSAGTFPRRSLSTLTKMALSATSEPVSV